MPSSKTLMVSAVTQQQTDGQNSTPQKLSYIVSDWCRTSSSKSSPQRMSVSIEKHWGLMTSPTCVVPVVLLRAVLEEDEAVSLQRFLSWLRQWGRGWACRALKDMEPMGWQDTERGHTGMATVMRGFSTRYGSGQWGLMECQKVFDKQEHRARSGRSRRNDRDVRRICQWEPWVWEGQQRIGRKEDDVWWKKNQRKKTLVLLTERWWAKMICCRGSVRIGSPKKWMLQLHRRISWVSLVKLEKNNYVDGLTLSYSKGLIGQDNKFQQQLWSVMWLPEKKLTEYKKIGLRRYSVLCESRCEGLSVHVRIKESVYSKNPRKQTGKIH